MTTVVERRGAVADFVAPLRLATVLLGVVWCLASCQPDATSPAAATEPGRTEQHPPAPHRATGLYGRVLDDLGIPIANVAVHAWTADTVTRLASGRGAGHGAGTPMADDDASSRTTAITAITDGDGAFHLAPPPGDVILVTRHPLFAPGLRHAHSFRGRAVDIGEWILPAHPGLLVDVRDDADKSLRDVSVRLTPGLRDAELPIPSGTTIARTDTTGIAIFYGVPPGPWIVTVTAPGRATTSLSHDQPEKPVTSPRVLVTLQVGHTLSGRLRTADGEPVADALMIATRRPGPGMSQDSRTPPIETRTDATGNFRLEGLRGGRQQLLVLSDDQGCLRQDDVVPNPGVLHLQLPRGREIHGQVLQGRTKRPLPGAVVTIQTGGGWPAFRHGGIFRPHTTTDAEGKFRFRGLPPGILSLRAESKSFCPATAGPLPPTAPGGSIPPAVTLVLEEGFRVTGQVLSPAGLPLEDAVIRTALQPTDESSPGGSWPRGTPTTVRTQTGGRFELENLLPGRYRLQVAAPGLPLLRTPPFDARPTAHLDLGSIRLQRGGSAHGTATDARGRPAAFATVHLRPETGPDAPAQNPSPVAETVQADAKGRFRLPPVPSGRYRMFYDYPDRQTPRAAAESRALTSVSVEVADRTNQTIDLRPRVR